MNHSNFRTSLRALAFTAFASAPALAQATMPDVLQIAPACRLAATVDLTPIAGSAALQLRGPANGLACVLLGSSDSDWNGIPLPVPLDAFGAQGCGLHVSGDLLATFMILDASGNALLPLPQPILSPPFPVFAQMLFLDPATLGIAGTSNAIAIDRAGGSAWANLGPAALADFDAGRIRPRQLSTAELAQFISDAQVSDATPQAADAWLRTLLALDDTQLRAALRGVQREAFASSGIHQLPVIDMTLDQLGLATDAVVAQCRQQLGEGLVPAAFRGRAGLEAIIDRAFAGGVGSWSCGAISFPNLFSISYRLPRFGWSAQANLTRQGSSDGCFNYRHNFSHNIAAITPTSPAALGMVGAHGLGWRLFGSSSSLYYRGPWASLFGITFVTMQAGMQIRKQ